MLVWNLKEFAVNEIFLPYCNTFDPCIWEAEYNDNLTPDQKFRYSNLKSYYISKIRSEVGFEWLIERVERNITWKKLIFERLSEIKFKFYEYLDPNNEFIKWVNKNLEEVKK